MNKVLGAGLLFMVLTRLLYGLEQNPVLILNTDETIQKYQLIESTYREYGFQDAQHLDMTSAPSDRWLDQQINFYDPRLIHAIGGVALKKVASQINRKVIFSSVINWNKYELSPNVYGVANEIDANRQLYLFKYYFPEVRKIGVIYSPKINQSWMDQAINVSKTIGLTVLSFPIQDSSLKFNTDLENFILSTDSVWLITDPAILSSEATVSHFFELCQRLNRPIFAYHPMFIDMGATLAIYVDPENIAQQTALFSKQILQGKPISVRVQNPAGSKVSMNLGKTERFAIVVNQRALQTVDNLILPDQDVLPQ